MQVGRFQIKGVATKPHGHHEAITKHMLTHSTDSIAKGVCVIFRALQAI